MTTHHLFRCAGRILHLYEKGKSTREIAQVFGFLRGRGSAACASSFQQRGTLEPADSSQRTARAATPRNAKQRLEKAALRAARRHAGRVRGTPGPALSALPRWICGSGGWAGGIKKNSGRRRTRPARRGRKKEHTGMNSWPASRCNRLVFVDESGAHTKMTRWRGRALGGQRLVGPHSLRKVSD